MFSSRAALTQEAGGGRKHGGWVTGCEKKTSAMKQGQCSKVNIKYPVVDSDVLSRVASISYLTKQNKKPLTQMFNKYCFLFSMSLLYLNSPSEE